MTDVIILFTYEYNILFPEVNIAYYDGRIFLSKE